MSATFEDFSIASHTKIKLYSPCTRGHHQGWAGGFVPGLWNWEKSVLNCRAVVVQGHQRQHFRSNRQFACFLVDQLYEKLFIFHCMPNVSSDLQKQNRLSQPSALEDVMKPKTSCSSHFPFLLLWLNHKTVFLYFLKLLSSSQERVWIQLCLHCCLKFSLSLVSFANDTISRIWMEREKNRYC